MKQHFQIYKTRWWFQVFFLIFTWNLGEMIQIDELPFFNNQVVGWMILRIPDPKNVISHPAR